MSKADIDALTRWKFEWCVLFLRRNTSSAPARTCAPAVARTHMK